MRSPCILLAALGALAVAGCDSLSDLAGCGELVLSGPRAFADSADRRFEGKVQKATAQCRGGDGAVNRRAAPWLDWANYYAAGDASSRSFWETKNRRGVRGALIDLEYQRVEMLRFNLFDNSGTFAQFLQGRDGVDGPALTTWPELRLPPDHPAFASVGGAGTQLCTGDLIRARTLTGICNDIQNPLMGATGTLFGRNVEFQTTFPDAGLTELTRNRHGNRLSLLTPDPQVISRRLFTRAQADSTKCNNGHGLPGYSPEAECDYRKTPYFNVLASFWIQFMNHDWFTHLDEGHNSPQQMSVGCASQKVNGTETPIDPAGAARLGCRPADRMDRAIVSPERTPPVFTDRGREHWLRAPHTSTNNSTAWFDASQMYGYDQRSRTRVKRDPADSARLLMSAAGPAQTAGDQQGYLPLLDAADPKLPDWAGQEATAFPDNWTVGMSFFHNVFAREHNQFVAAFRRRAAQTPDDDSGLRDPATPARVIRYRDVTANELFEVARLVVAAEIAKIHTIEWTTQLLYNEPLYRGMNANWSGLVPGDNVLSDAIASVMRTLERSNSAERAATWVSLLAAGPGIFGLGSRKEGWSITNPQDVNGGTNHFGAPFNFPEEFITVYRLHPIVPDLLEYRDQRQANTIVSKIPVVETFRGRATPFMRERGLSNWALSFGRQRLGTLELQNHPRFLQNLRIERLTSPTKQIDVAALDIIRDRERGIPRFNEFRRQYGLRQLTSFDDLIDQSLLAGSPERSRQQELVRTIREVYGQHRCDSSLVITRAARDQLDRLINDCLGHPNGSVIDNIEDLDTIVGLFAEPVRPHGFSISETQFVVFIVNASRRLFSDRFFTSSFRPEFYSTLGVAWVNNNGPAPMYESLSVNGHEHQPVSPFKRVLLRTLPELAPELQHVVNAFDPWARDRGEYYSLAWKPRKDAEADDSFRKP